MARPVWRPGPAFRGQMNPRGATLERHTAATQLPTGVMNKTEECYVAEILTPRALAGEILDWRFEPFSLRLAANCRWTPDFGIVTPSGFELVDVKGYQEETALVKIKVAASLFWWFPFTIAKRKTQKEGGGWSSERVKPHALGGLPFLAPELDRYRFQQGRLFWGDE